MNVDPLSTQSPAAAAFLAAQGAGAVKLPTAAQLAADRQTLATSNDQSTKAGAAPTPAQIKKVASQFEAIILRQLLAPSIEPMMSGGLGGSSQASGGGVYGYMLTDVMANSLASGGGLGLAHLLEKQFSPAASKADKQVNSPIPSQLTSPKS